MCRNCRGRWRMWQCGVGVKQLLVGELVELSLHSLNGARIQAIGHAESFHHTDLPLSAEEQIRKDAFQSPNTARTAAVLEFLGMVRGGEVHDVLSILEGKIQGSDLKASLQSGRFLKAPMRLCTMTSCADVEGTSGRATVEGLVAQRLTPCHHSRPPIYRAGSH